MARRRPPKPVILAILAVQTVSAVFAWRDLSHRSAAHLRGSRRFWRVAMLLNPGNSLFYWAVGRRRG